MSVSVLDAKKTSKKRSSRFWSKRLFSLSLLGALVGSSISASPAHATTFSNEGTEFYVTFNYGWFLAYDQSIYFSARQSGVVTIDWPSGPDTTHPVAANSTVTVDATNKGVYSSGSDQATAFISARISSTVPISVYGMMLGKVDQGSFTADAFTAIPTSSLGTAYRLMGPPQIRNAGEFSVVATEDGTTVTISPSAALSSRPANTPYTVSLSRGQVYTAKAPSNSDITGTLVTADKKVVVTSSNYCADLTTSCDHLIEYMTPIDSWGTSFLLPGSLNRGPSFDQTQIDRYRVLAHQNGTEVRVNGTLVTTLNAGQFYSYMGTAVGGVQRVDVVETSKPALIGHFLVGGRYGDTLYDRGLDWDDTPLPATELRGDPSFSLVIPTIQFLRQYNVATPTTGFRLHSLTLISMTSSVSTVRLNGAQIPAEYGAFSPIAGSDYSFARLQVPVGSYSLSSSTPLGVYGSGFDDDRSYAYPAGFGLVNLEEYPGGADSVPSAETGGGADSAPSVETGGGGNTTTPPTLAATGANLEWLMVAGLIPAIAGAGLLTVRRRKRSA